MALLAFVLGAGGVVAVADPVGAQAQDRPGWVDALSDDPSSGPESPPWEESTSAPEAESEGIEPAPFEFPAAAEWEAKLGPPDSAADQAANNRRPVGIAAGDRPTRDAASGKPASVEVFDQAASERMGVSGFVFEVDAADAVGNARSAEPLPAELSIDYSGFADAYGGGYGDRLRVVALPDCALEDPVPEGCETGGTPLETDNNTEADTLTVKVDDLAAPAASTEGEANTRAANDGVATFAVTAGVSGESGTYGATPLSASGEWNNSGGSGAYSWSYPMELPAPAAGSAPQVGLGYSSASVDGLSVATNTQATQVGLGWSDFSDAFIERAYEPCVNGGANNDLDSGDLCWGNDNAMISLNGVSGALVPDPANPSQWRLESDPGWRIERLTGSGVAIHEGQHWKVTGPDGTVYWFGRTAQAVAGVHVWADHPTDPCRAAGGGLGECNQAWRWMLERVEDPDGNIATYKYGKQGNTYECMNGLVDCRSSYTRNIFLNRIEYGARAGKEPSARVTFGWQYRCGYLVESCPKPGPTSGSGFPDAPADLICEGGTDCTVQSPSFFSTIHYTHVLSEVKVGGTWKTVTQDNLHKKWADSNEHVAKKLELKDIQHVGLAFSGDMIAQPPTTFEYTYRANRADHDANPAKAMRHDRLVGITNPLGAKTTVSYDFAGAPCAYTYSTDRWDLNTRPCYPQSIVDPYGFEDHGVFHKYVVKSVTVDPGSGGPMMTRSYDYEGTPAWAHDPSSFSRGDTRWAWSRWLGFASVVATTGEMKSRQKVFRGWNGDALLVQQGSEWITDYGARQVEAAPGMPDERWLAGRVLEEQTLGTVGGQAGQVVESEAYTYNSVVTLDGEHFFDPTWVGVESVTKSVATGPGQFRQSRSATSYNEHFQPTTTLEEGWLDATGDERCSITTYANDPARHMFTYPATNEIAPGSCTNPERLSRSETYYDGSTTLGALPGRGNPTRQRTQIDASTWSETSTDYDASGRPVNVIDPNGAVTTTEYKVTAGYGVTQIPIETVVTNAAGHKGSTEWHPEFGVPAAETDANGNRTTLYYDSLGRLTQVIQPERCSGCASWGFAYDEKNRAIRSRQHVGGTKSDPIYQDMWEIFDGLARPRQTQTLSPTAGVTVIQETTYTNTGQVHDETVAQGFTTGKYPGLYHSVGPWGNRTRHVYDDAGREVQSQWRRGAEVAWTSSTSYGADNVTVDGPGGVAREIIDAHGRTIRNEEKDGDTWVATNYGFDLADRLTSVTDPEGNVISYGYDMAGRRVSQQDPNRGSATFSYDLAGNQTSVTDASGQQIHTVYDQLGRPTERHAESPTGALLASWSYDSAAGGVGQLASSTSHAANGDWVSEVTGYDGRGRPTGSKLTVPSGIPGLSGSYTTSQSYDYADRVVSTELPAVGGLPAETLTTTYNSVGAATRLSGATDYVSKVAFDDRGRQTGVAFGPHVDGHAQIAASYAYNADQRMSATETFAAGSAATDGIVAEHNLSFNAAGSLTQDLTAQNGQAWRECFGYDARQRLNDAYTVDASATCESGTKGTGDQPYDHSYAYGPGGNMVERIEDGSTTDYTYPAAGADHPNAPTAVGGATFEWDAEGQLTKRTEDGATETYTWDVQGWLAKVSGPSGDTAFTYDTSGQRVLRTTSEGSTLYWAGHEISASTDGSTVTAVRSYSFGGAAIATRGPSGVQYLAGDVQGSLEMTIPDGGGDPDSSRTYEPYGQVRSEEGAKDTDRGFVGQIEDETTSLSYMNARYYNSDAGIFISADAVVASGTPESLNPYTYAAGSPATLSDPSGLSPMNSHNLSSQNFLLRWQNKMLHGIINRQSAQISDMAGVIKDQQRVINQLVSHVAALQGIIREQQSVIEQLQARVVYLEGQVAYWKGQAMYWYGRAMYWKGQAMMWRNRAMYWKGRYNYLRYNVVGPAFNHIYGPNAAAQLAKVDAMTWNAGDLPAAGSTPSSPGISARSAGGGAVGSGQAITLVDWPGSGWVDDLGQDFGCAMKWTGGGCYGSDDGGFEQDRWNIVSSIGKSIGKLLRPMSPPGLPPFVIIPCDAGGGQHEDKICPGNPPTHVS